MKPVHSFYTLRHHRQNRKGASQRRVGGYAVALATRWTPFWAARRRRILLRIGYRLGRRPPYIASRAAAGRHGELLL